ncbi:unnamed protein product [Gongylonema pulchrum]|uniref:JmjC domain-containing protein n=1 Tax=Gongylonema pulchrum TaxID=637853 RepID=A0A183DY35_9BILA|nr:unnamed protein product [Gongylonema pulchrum]
MLPTNKRGRLRKRILEAKKRARSELPKDSWSSAGFHKTFSELCRGLTADNIERIDASHLSVDEFVEKYEKRGIPVVLTGLTESWPATRKWCLHKLVKKYRNQKFKCGEDDDGRSVKLKLKYYAQYMQSTTDDSPLYVFDSAFGERHKTRRLVDDYRVPSFFVDDLFRYASEERRPPHRWFVMGPARSGTGIHVDPLGTSAWNALLKGRKKWCFFHPETPKCVVKPTSEEGGVHVDEAVIWFKTVYKRTSSCNWSKEWTPIEAVQYPGEIMFVPSGWWHVVLNLTDTIAVTQNFCSEVNLPSVYTKTLKGRPNFCKHWLKCLRKNRPDALTIIGYLSPLLVLLHRFWCYLNITLKFSNYSQFEGTQFSR